VRQQPHVVAGFAVLLAASVAAPAAPAGGAAPVVQAGAADTGPERSGGQPREAAQRPQARQPTPGTDPEPRDTPPSHGTAGAADTGPGEGMRAATRSARDARTIPGARRRPSLAADARASRLPARMEEGGVELEGAAQRPQAAWTVPGIILAARDATPGPGRAGAAAAPARQGDAAKERRWAGQIVDALIDGEAVWLEAGGRRFLAIYTPPSGRPRGGVVLLHGMGAHPDWPEVIHPLRVGLPERGWATLSVQLPVLPNGAASEDYAPLFEAALPRIEAAIAWLRGKGHTPLALAGHSLGAAMGAYFLAQRPRAGVRTFIAIGLPSRPGDPRTDAIGNLRRAPVPVLDLFGSLDLRGVLRDARARLAALAAAGAAGSRQVRVEGADHFFDGFEDELLAQVDGWLRRTLGAGSRKGN